MPCRAGPTGSKQGRALRATCRAETLWAAYREALWATYREPPYGPPVGEPYWKPYHPRVGNEDKVALTKTKQTLGDNFRTGVMPNR